MVAFLLCYSSFLGQATILNDIVSNAARAAERAAEAARALREAADRHNGSFSEASKVVKCPEFFGYVTADEDQNNWRDFCIFIQSLVDFCRC